LSGSANVRYASGGSIGFTSSDQSIHINPLDFTNWADGAPYQGMMPAGVAISSGTSPTNVPGTTSGPGIPFKEITSSTEIIRIYDNGVTYSIDLKTKNQYWGIPNQTAGGTQQITLYASGQMAREEFDANNVFQGELIYDRTHQILNLQQRVQRVSSHIPTYPFKTTTPRSISKTRSVSVLLANVGM
jgi:hypothetical protein